MGKRKNDSEKDCPLKRSKKSERNETKTNGNAENEQPQNEKVSNVAQKPTKIGGFDVKQLRKELAAKQEQTMALTQFLQVCLNPDNEVDYLLEYLKCGGNSHEILRQVTQENKKNLSLATPAFHLFHLIILKVQSSLPHMISITEEACRYFLNTFMSTVEIMISENSGPRHRKVVLRLLTSMVTLNADLGIEVLNQAPLTPKHLQHVVEKSNYKEKDNVRTTFVHFMTSFLVDGHLPLIKALLEKQGLLALVIPGLIHDEAEAVLMFLNILKKNIVDNAYVSKSLKLKTFSHQVLHNMFKIFSWKGPPELSQSRGGLRPEIMTLLSDIIVTLFTSHRLGLYFVDNSLGTTDANKNQNLYKALLTLKRPWENEQECEVILQIVYKCPDLHRALINIIEQSFEPQHSPIWEKTVDFTIKLLNKLKPEEMISRITNLNPAQVANFVRFVTLPVPLLKFIQSNLEKDQTISLYIIKVLVKMLQTLKCYMQILETEDSSAQILDLKNKLEYFLPKHLPAPGSVVSLIDNVINGKSNIDSKTQDYKLPNISDTDSLTHLVDLLLLYSDIHPAFFETLEGNIDMKKILDYSMKLSHGHTALLKFKTVSLWLTLDNSSISLKNPIFKDLFLIMLEVYMSDNDSTWIEAKDTLRIFFKNTAIFETDEDEMHLMLYTLRNAKVEPPSLVGDIIEYVLENIKDLTDYVRNQLVHFEISDRDSEACLEKLFNDLMENQNTEDSVFLENKVPSPFIVGCMQYLQLNKEVKKNLKHFLSLYIANLLHSNYSPELTEILIGDSKLDVRNYVASWTGQPVALPEMIVEDNVLKNISKSIVCNEEFTIEEIFPFLEEAEGSDVTVNCVAYKVDVSRNIDCSELLVWAKYLVFCTVRLTNMGQLTEEKQQKITDYFQCIIAIGRRHHMVDVCRTIILSLCKNPHVLKIYKPLDLNKDETYLSATKFILAVITKQKDIINYLNAKYKLLKSYQQKNYNEIVKAFVKINKKKNVNSEHTINVLTVVGLDKEDDLRVFNQIFSAEVDSYLRDDKEPSLVLELLRYLVEKYSKFVTFELQPQILRKCMKLYTDVLINKDMNANLTNLENALAEYFENKPHQAIRISEDIFKKFFDVNIIRKSTSNLASVLLKFNAKLCSVFKEQTLRAEILSQRELTLPLGNAVINHKQFLLENKEFLTNIFNEYKSNINKLLEKPHKAGQIYVSNWQFIRKLVLECMDVQDCVKLFSKSYKFEVVDLCHVNLIQSIFLKMCISEIDIKKDHLINYFLSMLHICTTALKEAKEVNVVNDVIAKIHTIAQISRNLNGLNIEQKGDFKKVTESVMWQNFCKAVLKDSLKVKTVDQGYTIGPKLLLVLTDLIKLFYPIDHEDISTLFDMVTSHSEFLNVMLSHHSTDIKSRLIEFLYTLILRNKSVMKVQQVPVYLSAYHATRSPCDRLILAIIYYYESNGLPVNEYKPYVWGDSAANHYAVRKTRTASLWAHPTPNQVLNLFEKDVIEKTVRNFPVTQKLDYHYELPSDVDTANGERFDIGSIKGVLDNMSKDGAFKPVQIKDTEAAVKHLIIKSKYKRLLLEIQDKDIVVNSHLDEDDGIYDPIFLFPLLGHLLAPGSVASCFKLLRTGLLSVPVMALSSHCPMVRAAAYHVLHRFCMLLDTETRHKNDKLFLTDFINTLHHSLTTAINNADNAGEVMKGLKNPRTPAVDALYLAKALMVSTAPGDPLYKPVNNFLIAKQFVDLTVVPDFLSLFHDSDVESVDRRLWILDVIRDGVKTMTDVNVIFKTMCLKMVMDYYSSVLSDKRVKERILSVIVAIVAVPRAFEIMVEGYGLISWLHSVVRELEKDDKSLIKGVISLIKNMIYSMNVNSFARNIAAKNNGNGNVSDFIEIKTNKNVENEIIIIVHDLLKILDNLEIEDVISYINIYKLISKRTLKNLNKKQILNLVSKIGDFYKDCENITVLIKALVSKDNNVLKSKNLNISPKIRPKQDLISNLSAVVQAYLV